jgi:hypothetical protein
MWNKKEIISDLLWIGGVSIIFYVLISFNFLHDTNIYKENFKKIQNEKDLTNILK